MLCKLHLQFFLNSSDIAKRFEMLMYYQYYAVLVWNSLEWCPGTDFSGTRTVSLAVCISLLAPPALQN